MAKVDISKIVSDMQKLYSKDKKVTSIITTGDQVKSDYTEKDGVPLPENSVLRGLIGLPVLPYNKIVEFAGKKDTGKSTLSAEAMVCAQGAKIQVIVWDSEDKLDTNRFKSMKGNPKDLLVIKTNEILKGGELVRKYIHAIKEQDPEAKIFFVWDSIGGSQSRSHAERELDNEKHAQPGQDAKEIVSVMKTLVSLINKYPDAISVYVCNQVYTKMGFMQKGDATSGGPKKDHYFSFSAILKQVKPITFTSKGVLLKKGILSKATVTKNHLSQGPTSVHQLSFTINAEGAKLSEEVVTDDSDED